MLKQDPDIIHEVLGADVYVYLQTPLIGQKIIDVNSPSFSYIFEYLAHEYKREQNPK